MSSTVLEATSSTSSLPRASAPRADLVRACRCGQDLDTCRAAHCPRCGVTLR